MLWVDKYKPKNLNEWVGDPEVKSTVKNYFTSMLYGSPLVKCLVLSGSAGNGKTSLIYAMANEMDLNVIEVNGSDKRGKNDLKKVKQQAYLSNEKLNVVLIDEADGIRSYDELIDLVNPRPKSKDSFPPCPVVLTCNDVSKISWKLMKLALQVTISYPPNFVVEDRLKDIVSLESLNNISNENICEIVNKCTNVRSCIYTLQQFSMGRLDKIENLDTQFTMVDKIRKLFKGESVYLTNTECNEVFNWGVTNHIDIKQLSQLSTLQSIGRKVSGMQDLVRDFIYMIRGNVGKIKTPVSRWKKKYKKDKKLIKKLDNNNKKLSVKIDLHKESKPSKPDTPQIDIKKKLDLPSTGSNVEDLF